jgi:hypothetical protein
LVQTGHKQYTLGFEPLSRITVNFTAEFSNGMTLPKRSSHLRLLPSLLLVLQSMAIALSLLLYFGAFFYEGVCLTVGIVMLIVPLLIGLHWIMRPDRFHSCCLMASIALSIAGYYLLLPSFS